MNKINKALVLVTAIIMVSSSTILIDVGLSYIEWTKTFTFTVANISFKVYKDASCTQEWTAGSESLGVLNVGQNIKTFYLKNDGNTAVTVTVTGESLTGSGNTKSWSATSKTLNPGQTGSLTLTLNIQSNGSYTFSFSKT